MKKALREKIFAKSNGMCIYCGGSETASTVDHMPPIILFRLKDRPRGFEFASCEACNVGASHSDLVAAMFTRAFPNVESHEVPEIKKIFVSVRNNIPGLLEEMFVESDAWAVASARIGSQVKNPKFIAMDGPIAMAHLRAFGARLALAMHFNQTGQIIPKSGGATVRIYSNLDMMEGRIPEGLFEILPKPTALVAGRKDTSSQFRMSTVAAEGGGMTITLASFRFSFAVASAAADKVEKLIDQSFPPEAAPHRPGDLKRF